MTNLVKSNQNILKEERWSDCNSYKRTSEFNPNPTKLLHSGNVVHIQTKRNDLTKSSNDEMVFYLVLKRTPGCTSKFEHDSEIMHLYIERDSDAAHMFVRRIMSKHSGLPAHSEEVKLLSQQTQLLLSELNF